MRRWFDRWSRDRWIWIGRLNKKSSRFGCSRERATGVEPVIFRVTGGCDSHYTIGPKKSDKHFWYCDSTIHSRVISLSKTMLARQIQQGHPRNDLFFLTAFPCYRLAPKNSLLKKIQLSLSGIFIMRRWLQAMRCRGSVEFKDPKPSAKTFIFY